jgi:hypothetical protein
LERKITAKNLEQLSLLNAMKFHVLVNSLFLRQPVIERVGAYIANQLLQEDLYENVRGRYWLLFNYLHVNTLRNKTSKRQIEDALNVIDRYHDVFTEPGTDIRLVTKATLAKFEELTRPHNSPMHDLHQKVKKLAFRNKSLITNEQEKLKEEKAAQVLEVREMVKRMSEEQNEDEII